MKYAYLVAAVCIGLASSGPAFARNGWTAPMNGTLSAVTMPDGDVMMMVKLPPEQFMAIGREMKLSHDTCLIKDTDPVSTDNSMILICGKGGSTVQ